MNLRDLHYLATLAETLHFGRAAELCHVSQPTLSMQIKKLEDYLGVQLIERSNKHVMLTPMGEEIAARAARITSEAVQLRAVAKAAQDPLGGRIRMGLFPTLAPYFLPLAMPKLAAAFPKLQCDLVEEKTPLLVDMLQTGKIECALLALPVDGGDWATYPLFEEPFWLAVPATHALAKRHTITLADVPTEGMLLLEDGHCLRDQALAVCHRLGAAESQDFRATSLETLRHMVAAGRGITFLPELATRQKTANVAYLPFAEAASAPSRTIGLIARRTTARTRLWGHMADLLRSCVTPDAPKPPRLRRP